MEASSEARRVRARMEKESEGSLLLPLAPTALRLLLSVLELGITESDNHNLLKSGQGNCQTDVYLVNKCFSLSLHRALF